VTRFPTLLLLLLCTCGPAQMIVLAQDGLFPAFDIRSQLMGGTGLAADGIDALWTNPAGLANAEQTLAANATAQQRFGLAELTTTTAGVAYGTGIGGFGLQLGSFGFSTYRETRIGLAYGRKLTDKLRFGAEFTGFATSTEAYASTFDVTFGVGLQLEIIPELHVGARLFSPLRVEREPEEYLPQLLALGISYRPTDQLTLNAEVHQDADHPVRVRVGVEYLPAESISIRLGVASEASEISFGLGYQLIDRLELSAGANWHEVLGVWPGVGVRWK